MSLLSFPLSFPFPPIVSLIVVIGLILFISEYALSFAAAAVALFRVSLPALRRIAAGESVLSGALVHSAVRG